MCKDKKNIFETTKKKEKSLEVTNKAISFISITIEYFLP